MKGIKQTSIVVILTILLASTPACQSVKVLPVERSVTETGTALTAQDKFNGQCLDIADNLLIHADMESIFMQSAGLDAENRPTAAADSATSGQSQISERTVSESSQTASATLENNETIGQSAPTSTSSSIETSTTSTETVPQTTSTPPLTTSQSRSTTEPSTALLPTPNNTSVTTQSTTPPTTTIPTTVQTTTTQPPTQPVITKPTFTSDQWIAEILRLTNAARTGQGLNPFSTINSQLLQAATLRANELTSTYSHYRPDGSECFTALDECKVSWSTSTENIAQASAGFYTPQDIVNGWMNSPEHRANILNGDLTNIAVGYAKANGKEYFVQLFMG